MFSVMSMVTDIWCIFLKEPPPRFVIIWMLHGLNKTDSYSSASTIVIKALNSLIPRNAPTNSLPSHHHWWVNATGNVTETDSLISSMLTSCRVQFQISVISFSAMTDCYSSLLPQRSGTLTDDDKCVATSYTAILLCYSVLRRILAHSWTLCQT